MRLLTKHQDLGREVWIHFDESAEVYELFASSAGDDYIGCADTIQEAKQIASDWFKELMGE